MSADDLQARLHVAACSYLIPLLHLLGTAGRAFGLANLKIGTWQQNQQRWDRSLDEWGEGAGKPLVFNFKNRNLFHLIHTKKDSATSSACKTQETLSTADFAALMSI